eukprot:6213678-Pleurochrysis_carterae.AAC.1
MREMVFTHNRGQKEQAKCAGLTNISIARQCRLRLEREPLSEITGNCAEARGKGTLAAASPYYERENI